MIFEIFQAVGLILYISADTHRIKYLNKKLDERQILEHNRHIHRLNEKILANNGLNLDAEITLKMFKDIESKRWDPPEPYVFGKNLIELIKFGSDDIMLTYNHTRFQIR